MILNGLIVLFIERLFQGSLNFYRTTLRFSLRYRALMMVLAAAMIGLSVWLVILVPKGFVPTEDTGRLNVTMEAAEDISFDAMVRLTRQASAIVGANPTARCLAANTSRS